ncbi:hypothetical protein BDF20DRAFT_991353 [Mycotypha africana]|uniref:uncharacterized protein n=1 Tax=Mycotypha africana TaxID=64632 RepID=UPI0023012AFF|nr:uncharacterized protein BDF20DRAFT_991353 [Mycotypha africana]KAI8968424.1 hypothetical protein BDF20DRAFT_991353 [Mycotypha africana]
MYQRTGHQFNVKDWISIFPRDNVDALVGIPRIKVSVILRKTPTLIISIAAAFLGIVRNCSGTAQFSKHVSCLLSLVRKGLLCKNSVIISTVSSVNAYTSSLAHYDLRATVVTVGQDKRSLISYRSVQKRVHFPIRKHKESIKILVTLSNVGVIYLCKFLCVQPRDLSSSIKHIVLSQASLEDSTATIMLLDITETQIHDNCMMKLHNTLEEAISKRSKQRVSFVFHRACAILIGISYACTVLFIMSFQTCVVIQLKIDAALKSEYKDILELYEAY